MCPPATRCRKEVFLYTSGIKLTEHHKAMALYFRKRVEKKAEIAVWKIEETEEEKVLEAGDAPADTRIKPRREREALAFLPEGKKNRGSDDPDDGRDEESERQGEFLEDRDLLKSREAEGQ